MWLCGLAHPQWEQTEVSLSHKNLYIHTYIHTIKLNHFSAAAAQKSTGAEDFSFFLEERPGRYIHTVHTYIHTYIHHTYVHHIDMNVYLNNKAVLLYCMCCCIGCFFFVGAALPGDLRPHHKSVFDFDEVTV